eukprot:scpid58167/ scgid21974/ 
MVGLCQAAKNVLQQPFSTENNWYNKSSVQQSVSKKWLANIGRFVNVRAHKVWRWRESIPRAPMYVHIHPDTLPHTQNNNQARVHTRRTHTHKTHTQTHTHSLSHAQKEHEPQKQLVAANSVIFV